MKALIPLATFLAAMTTIVTGWWNLVIRKRVAAARIEAARRGAVEKVRVESTFAMWVRRAITTTVVLSLCVAVLVGVIILSKSVIELF